MLIHDAPPEVRADAQLLFDIGRQLSGCDCEPNDHWYKFVHKSGSGYAWLRLIGDRARKYPQRSLHLVVKPDARHDHDSRLQTGQDWWGKEDRHLVVVAGDRAALAAAVELLARAFWIDDQQSG